MTSTSTVSRRWTLALGASALLAAAAFTGTAHAKEGQLRIAQQFGINYLLLDVAKDQQLIEKHGKAQGIDIKVEFVKLSGGSVINEALLAGNIDIAGAGLGPLFTIWDRTQGRHNVKGVASLGNFPYLLVSNNTAVKTLDDLSDQDRIAVPAVGVSVQSRMLQLAAAQHWGDAHYKRLDKLQVALPHPDAAAAVIKGGTEVNAHFASPPFSDQALAANPNARVVLKSYDVMGGPSSATVLYSTEKFHKDSPKTYQALVEALHEAAEFTKKHPEKAADIYLQSNGGGIDRSLLLRVIQSPDVQFTVQPQRTLALGQFLHRVGAIKRQPQALGDYFFDNARVSGGN